MPKSSATNATLKRKRMADEGERTSSKPAVSADTLPMAGQPGRVVTVSGTTYIDDGATWIELPSGGGSGLTQSQIEGLI